MPTDLPLVADAFGGALVANLIVAAEKTRRIEGVAWRGDRQATGKGKGNVEWEFGAMSRDDDIPPRPWNLLEPYEVTRHSCISYS